MGTSSSGGGASGSNPLIPSWIPPISNPPRQNPDDNQDQGDSGNGPVPDQKPPDAIPAPTPLPNNGRYRQPKSDFNKFVKSSGKDKSAFSNALKGYSRSGGSGNTQILARRMRPSAIRVANFYGRFKQIMDFFKPQITGIGMTMTVHYEIVQCQNRSTKLRIKFLSNYDLKK